MRAGFSLVTVLCFALGFALVCQAEGPDDQYVLGPDSQIKKDVPQGKVIQMPAWTNSAIGVKVVTYIPGALAHGAPTVGATYLLLERTTGEPRAVIDGDAITVSPCGAVSFSRDLTPRKINFLSSGN